MQSLSQQTFVVTLAVLTGALLGIALLASACSASPVTSGPVPTNNTSAASATASTDPSGTDPGRIYNVTLNDSNRFEPASLTVPRGATRVVDEPGQTTHTVTGDPAKAIQHGCRAPKWCAGMGLWECGWWPVLQPHVRKCSPASTSISVCRMSPLAAPHCLVALDRRRHAWRDHNARRAGVPARPELTIHAAIAVYRTRSAATDPSPA